jgi:hypothetical protein
MAHSNQLKPSHKAIQQYYARLQIYRDQKVTHEGATETAFSRLLADSAHAHGWTLIPKLPMRVGANHIAPDGTVKDEFNLKRGFWEAKDTDDDLDKEIRRKIDKGYPLGNMIFEDTRQAVLYQNGQEANRYDLTEPQKPTLGAAPREIPALRKLLTEASVLDGNGVSPPRPGSA